MKRFLKNNNQSPYNEPAASAVDPKCLPKLFVHIPKTAGTSFRKAAESRFGLSRVLRDYGPNSDATSDSIKREIYADDDATQIYRAIAQENPAMLSGHFPLQKYGGILGLTNTVSIFRSPVDQVISHFRHAVRDHGYKGGLLTFARQNPKRNLQSKVLGNNDPALLGVVGITESYKTMLKIVNFRWGWNLRHRKKNVSRKFGVRKFEASDQERFEIARLNEADLSTYKRAQLVFENSCWCFERGFECDTRGCITLANTKFGIRGWAFDMCSDDLMQIEILLNGKPFHRVKCSLFVPSVACWKLPRNGYVGFAIDNLAVAEGDHVEIRDAQHGLLLADTIVAAA